MNNNTVATNRSKSVLESRETKRTNAISLLR